MEYRGKTPWYTGENLGGRTKVGTMGGYFNSRYSTLFTLGVHFFPSLWFVCP